MLESLTINWQRAAERSLRHDFCIPDWSVHLDFTNRASDCVVGSIQKGKTIIEKSINKSFQKLQLIVESLRTSYT